MTKKEKADFLFRRYDELKDNFLNNHEEASILLAQIAELDPKSFAMEWKRLVKKYRYEIATDYYAAYYVVGGLLYRVAEVYEDYIGDIRKWLLVYRFMLDDDEVNRIVFKECCHELSCEDKLLNCVITEGKTEILDTLVSYIFSNTNRIEQTISQTYDNFYYYECNNPKAKKAVSDIIEKYIKAIPDQIEKDKCLGKFFQTQCVLEDDCDDIIILEEEDIDDSSYPEDDEW